MPGWSTRFTLNAALAGILDFVLKKFFFFVFPQKRSFPVALSGSFQSGMNGSFCNTTKLPLSVSIVHLLLETSQAGIMQEKNESLKFIGVSFGFVFTTSFTVIFKDIAD